MAPMFSVVIPTYNQADYLRIALRSVLEQTYQDYEVIVVNNFSTDHTLDVIRQIKDPRVRAINFRNNGVIGVGRNVGIRASVGTYVAFLDSDDTWYENKLERVSEAIQEDPEVGLLCHDQDLLRDGRRAGRAHLGPPQGYKGNLYDCQLLRGNCVSTSATVVARRCLDEVGYFSEDPALVTVEDYDLWLRLSRVCRFHFIREGLGQHHYHRAGASANAEVHLKATLAVLEKHFGRRQGSDRSYARWAMRRQYSNAFYAAARQYQRRGAVIKPLGYYFRTLRIYPLHPRAYAGLALLGVDLVLGKDRRRRITQALWPGASPSGW